MRHLPRSVRCLSCAVFACRAASAVAAAASTAWTRWLRTLLRTRLRLRSAANARPKLPPRWLLRALLPLATATATTRRWAPQRTKQRWCAACAAVSRRLLARGFARCTLLRGVLTWPGRPLAGCGGARRPHDVGGGLSGRRCCASADGSCLLLGGPAVRLAPAALAARARGACASLFAARRPAAGRAGGGMRVRSACRARRASRARRRLACRSLRFFFCHPCCAPAALLRRGGALAFRAAAARLVAPGARGRHSASGGSLGPFLCAAQPPGAPFPDGIACHVSTACAAGLGPFRVGLPRGASGGGVRPACRYG